MRGSAEALVFVDGDEKYEMGERQVLNDLDFESLRECWGGEDATLCVSLTHGNGVRIHAVIRPIEQEKRMIALSRRPAFRSMRLALDEVLEAAANRSAEAAEVARDVVLCSREVEGERDSLCRLSGMGIVRAWMALLLECRIVLRSSTHEHLAPLAASLACCAEPIEYAHVYAPVLPSSDAVELLSAPVPFFVGVDDRDISAWNGKTEAMCIKSCVGASLLERDGCVFDATMLEDGIVVIDADRGETLWPDTMTQALGSLANLDQLSRKVGRIMRDESPRNACVFLQNLTSALFAPRNSPDDKIVVSGRLVWEDATTWAEFDGLAFWAYPTVAEDSSVEAAFAKARNFLKLWLPVESLASVSPLDAVRFELIAKNDGLTWCDETRCGRFAFVAPDETSSRLWASALEAAVTTKSTRCRLEEASETTRLRDAVVRTQDARLMLKRRTEETLLATSKNVSMESLHEQDRPPKSPVRSALRDFFSPSTKSPSTRSSLMGRWSRTRPADEGHDTTNRSLSTILRLALEKGDAAVLESPQSSPAAATSRRSETRSIDSFDRASTSASEDAGREVLVQRPRLLISLCDEDEVVLSSGALNVTRAPLSDDEKRRARMSSKTQIGASLWRTNQEVVALLDRLVATVRLTSSIPASPRKNENSSLSPLRVITRRKLFDDDDHDFDGDHGQQLRHTRLDAVRSSTGFAAFEEAASLLNRIDAETLVRNEEEDEEEDAARIAFWINVHNLAVLHACIARNPPPTSRGPSLVVRYYAWSRSHKYAVGGFVFSIFQIEHAILRARTNDRYSKGWISDLARFARNDDRHLLSPRQPPPRELGFALFAATKSSSPLAVFRATSKAGFEAELRAQAAKTIAQFTRIKTNPNVNDQERNFVVVLPPVMRWYASEWGATTLDVIQSVHCLLEQECDDTRLAKVISAARDDDAPSTTKRHNSWPSPGHANNNRSAAAAKASLRLEYPSYEWSPHLALLKNM